MFTTVASSTIMSCAMAITASASQRLGSGSTVSKDSVITTSLAGRKARGLDDAMHLKGKVRRRGPSPVYAARQHAWITSHQQVLVDRRQSAIGGLTPKC